MSLGREPLPAGSPDPHIAHLVELLTLSQARELELSEHVARLERAIKELEQRTSKRIASLMVNAQIELLLNEGLTSDQADILRAVHAMTPDKMKEAEELLSKLEGQPLTAALAKSISTLLKKQEWSVLCGTCGVPSSILWVPRSGHKNQGNGTYQHAHPTEKGKNLMHKKFSTLPHLRLVQRVDRRKKPPTSNE